MTAARVQWEFADLAAETAAGLRKHFERIGGIPAMLRLTPGHWRLIVLALEQAALETPQAPHEAVLQAKLEATVDSGQPLDALTAAEILALAFPARKEQLRDASAPGNFPMCADCGAWTCGACGALHLVETEPSSTESDPSRLATKLTVERLTALLLYAENLGMTVDEEAEWLLPRLAGRHD